MKKLIFYGFLGVCSVVLVFSSYKLEDESMAIVAEVEPQKTAVSFPKPVRVKKIEVKPGQKIKKGELLVQVERPDLALDIQQTLNKIKQVEKEILKLENQYLNELQKERIDKNLQVERHAAELAQKRAELKADSLKFSNLGSSGETFLNNLRYKIKSLQQEIALTHQQYKATVDALSSIYQREKEILALEQQTLEEELNALSQESRNLNQYSPLNGTIGSIAVQLEELVPPYQNLMSIYSENPNIIKGYLNEQSNMDILVGTEVSVESISREYSIAGKVIEVGSRIVSYPRQMMGIIQQDRWGKEIFVEIPGDNKFLNGEKVYVVLQR